LTQHGRSRGIVLGLLALVIIAFDQWTKAWVRDTIPVYTSWNPIEWLEPYVTLTHVKNTGAAFGILQNANVLFIVIALAVVLLIVVYHRQLAQGSWLLTVAFGLQVGGAAGNLIDRLVRGYVTDFVDVRVWPIFNVADSAIVVGTALLAYYAIFLDPGEDAAPESAEPTDGSQVPQAE
jgi:signal peptidase II